MAGPKFHHRWSNIPGRRGRVPPKPLAPGQMREEGLCAVCTQTEVMRKSARAIIMIGLGLAPIVSLALLRSAFAAPVLLYNPSTSEPNGLYRLTGAAPAPGRLIAFHVRPPGLAYAASHIRYVVRNSILKEIVAGAGSTVCESDGSVFVDGQRRGSVTARDHNGDALPHLSGCRRLGAGEYFALSNRIPNSFDSRFYGPGLAADVVGVYR
jgi:type IV secretory pathway protease TraF